MRIAIHQPNFIPWFPFFYKMAMVDKLIILNTVQFEKNGFQNRFNYKDKWITKPVTSGNDLIVHKKYTDGTELDVLNEDWIRVIAKTLSIKTQIVQPRSAYGCKHWGHQPGMFSDPTMNLISMIQDQSGTTYVTNPSAKDKYLDEDKMKSEGINIEYCKVPKNLNKSTFEIIEEYGIEGAIKQLPCKALVTS